MQEKKAVSQEDADEQSERDDSEAEEEVLNRMACTRRRLLRY